MFVFFLFLVKAGLEQDRKDLYRSDDLVPHEFYIRTHLFEPWDAGQLIIRHSLFMWLSQAIDIDFDSVLIEDVVVGYSGALFYGAVSTFSLNRVVVLKSRETAMSIISPVIFFSEFVILDSPEMHYSALFLTDGGFLGEENWEISNSNFSNLLTDCLLFLQKSEDCSIDLYFLNFFDIKMVDFAARGLITHETYEPTSGLCSFSDSNILECSVSSDDDHPLFNSYGFDFEIRSIFVCRCEAQAFAMTWGEIIFENILLQDCAFEDDDANEYYNDDDAFEVVSDEECILTDIEISSNANIPEYISLWTLPMFFATHYFTPTNEFTQSIEFSPSSLLTQSIEFSSSSLLTASIGFLHQIY